MHTAGGHSSRTPHTPHPTLHTPHAAGGHSSHRQRTCKSDANGSVIATFETARRDAPYDTSTPASVVFTPYGYTPMAPSPLRTTRFVQNAPVGYGLVTRPHKAVGGSGCITGRNVVVRNNACSLATLAPRDMAYVSRNVSEATTIPVTATSLYFFLSKSPPPSPDANASSARHSDEDGGGGGGGGGDEPSSTLPPIGVYSPRIHIRPPAVVAIYPRGQRPNNRNASHETHERDELMDIRTPCGTQSNLNSLEEMWRRGVMMTPPPTTPHQGKNLFIKPQES